MENELLELAQYLWKPPRNDDLSEQEIQELDLITLRRRLTEKSATKEEFESVSVTRRKLKSRVYAQDARDRHRVEMLRLKQLKKKLEDEKKNLLIQIKSFENSINIKNH
ncbi:hypothetical protein LOD99_12857 [Oopsacas minuta]|uniref:Basic leucine zipper domain-containing protein n=1 Tax=Oopsacas minuta TaxID=111878 RepID=A0AAV7JDA0_9METZ|nr:hypothetical protein LOD99_12857 [Oopsacas minuta]